MPRKFFIGGEGVVRGVRGNCLLGEEWGVRGLSSLNLQCEFNYIEFSWQPENAHTTVLVVCALWHYADKYISIVQKKKKNQMILDYSYML